MTWKELKDKISLMTDRRRATTRSCSMGRKYESNERLFLGENRRGYVLQL